MWKCQECGRKFKTTRAAERASDKGCPKCGGVDIDLDSATPPVVPSAERMTKPLNVVPVEEYILKHPDPQRGRYIFRPSADIVQVEFEGRNFKGDGPSETTYYIMPRIEARDFYKRLWRQGFRDPSSKVKE